jgi:hypothetical protein
MAQASIARPPGELTAVVQSDTPGAVGAGIVEASDDALAGHTAFQPNTGQSDVAHREMTQSGSTGQRPFQLAATYNGRVAMKY